MADKAFNLEQALYGSWQTAHSTALFFSTDLKCYNLEHLMENGRFLEVGCGDGKDMREIQKLYPKAHYFGLDTSKNAVRWSKQNNPQADIIIGCIQQIPFEADTFDIVYSSLILSYAQNRANSPFFKYVKRAMLGAIAFRIEDVANETYRILKKGGIYYLFDVLEENEVGMFVNRGFKMIHDTSTRFVFQK